MAGNTEMDERLRSFLEALKKDFEALPYPVTVPEEKIVTFEKMLPAPDGVGLRTVFTLPRNVEKIDVESEEPCEDAGCENSSRAFPVIVQRSCYPFQEAMMKFTAREYAKRGFGYVFQMCRGTGGSEGVWEPNVNDRADGLSLMNYLNEKPWVESMGYQGASYLAFTGWIMADAMPEKVKALYLTVYGTDRHTSAYKDGLFRQDILTAWAMDNAGRKIDADYLDSAAYMPQVEVDIVMWGGELSWYRDWITNTSRTDEYWKEGLWKQLREIPSKVTIPVYIVEGWYDHHLGSALKGYETLNQKAIEHSVLKIGPWNHGSQPAITGHPDQKNGFSKGNEDMFRWFYEILVEGKLPDRSVDWYVIGEDDWRTFPAYPVKPESEVHFYLKDQGSLYQAESDGDAAVAELPSGSRTYTYDPGDPVMSHGGESLFKTQQEIGSLLQPEPDSRQDIISFVSEPLKEALTIIGKIKASLYVSSDAQDTCFTIKVMEVFENGEAYNIRNGITTLAYRNGAEDRITYTPGTIEKIDIETWDIAWQVKKGSRIRIDISSSNFPEYAIHPNIPGIWSLIDRTKEAEQTIYFGKDYPSELILPVAD